MNIRITDLGLAFNRETNIARRRATTADIEQDIGSGKEVRRPSDDPAAAAQLMRHRDRLRRIEQFQRNNTNAKLWVGAADRALQSTASSLSRARSLGVQAGNATLGSVELGAIAADIRAISEEIRTLANVKASGRAVFAGTAATNDAYDPSGNYQGDLAVVSRSIDSGEKVTVGLPGPEVFGTANPGDPLNGSIFESLESLATAVESGTSVDLEAAMASVLTATDRVSAGQGRIGAVSRQLDAAELRQGGEQVSVTSSISELQDTDVAEAIIRLRSAEAGYEATMAATARGLSTSLLDFLR